MSPGADFDRGQTMPGYAAVRTTPPEQRHIMIWLVIFCAGLAFSQPAQAQLTFQRLKSFGILSQAVAGPQAMIQGNDGSLYGIAGLVVYRMNKDGSGLTVLASGLSGGNALIQGVDGVLYGTTSYGGTYDEGTIFKVNTDGTGYQVLSSFGYGNAENVAGLVQGVDGELYGTTKGGSGYDGTVFRMNTNGTGLSTLHSFSGGSGGENPAATVIQGADGFLYGTTENGGADGFGTVFKVNTNGNSFSIIHPFSDTGNDGSTPVGALIQGNNGALYGTTSDGGTNVDSYGVVFTLNTNGSGYLTLHSFNLTDGEEPSAALVQGSDGALYGTAYAGGNDNYGAIFKLNTDGSGFELLHSFTTPNSTYNTNVDGYYPAEPLIQESDGTIYGTAPNGGNGYGTAFKLNTDGTGFIVIQSFSNTGGDGTVPSTYLTQGNNGTIYGSTSAGGSVGSAGNGTIFKMNPDGSGYLVLTNLPGLDAYNSGNLTSEAGYQVNVTLGNDGNLYGTTYSVGGGGLGEVFKLNTNGSGFTVLHAFTGVPDGAHPAAPLLQGIDGALYGTTTSGGTNIVDTSGYGTVFKINTDGSGYKILYYLPRFGLTSFGGFPLGKLAQGSDSMLYGTTYYGGTNGDWGTLYKLATNGSGFVVIHSFGAGTDGVEPEAGVIQGTDGALYGTANAGGANDQGGMIFKLNTDGSGYTDIFDFQPESPATTGSNPSSSLVQGTDGSLYGTAGGGGGGYGVGTVFKLNTDGSGFTVLYAFLNTATTNGEDPLGTLLEGSNGSFYGTAQIGGSMDYGTIFALISSQPPTITAPSSVCANSTGNTASGPSGAASYAWTITGGTITAGANAQTVTFTAGASGSVVMGLTVPTGSNSDSITINPVPSTPGISTALSVCTNSTGNMASGPAGAASYAWTITGGIITSGANAQTVTYTAAGGTSVMLTLTVANASGCAASGSTTVAVDGHPVPGSFTLGVVGGASAQLPTSELTSVGSSPNGGTLSIIAVYSPSAKSGTVALSPNMQTITYTPTNSFYGQDSFNYVLSDGFCQAVGTVNVSVGVANIPAKNEISITPESGEFVLEFLGMPGQAYVVWSAPAITGPWMQLSGDLTADANGLVIYALPAPPATEEYYRIRSGP